MNWTDIKPWIAKLAPMLGTALGGPLGGAAGALLGSALGIKDASPESVKAAIQNGTLTGDQIVALRKAEEDFQIQCQSMGFKDKEALAALEFQDRDSARKREETVLDWTPRMLAYLTTAGFFGVLIWVLKFGIPSDPVSHDVILVLIGALGSAWAQNVMGYYFGGSSDANAHIQGLTKQIGGDGKL